MCATRSPALNRECRPSQPCPAELDCIYLPGCADPKGRCLPWARCSDAANLEAPICGCDGVERVSRMHPFPVEPGIGSGSVDTRCPKDASPD